MGVRDGFAGSARDKRMADLRIARRNFERWATPALRDALLSGGLFEIYEELLAIDPDSHVVGCGPTKAGESDIPWFRWPTREGHECTLLIFFHPPSVEFSVSRWDGNHHQDRKGDTILIEDLAAPGSLEAAIVDLLAASGLDVNRKPRIDLTGAEDPHGYYEALRLHPLAFRDLTEDEAQELIRMAYRFAAQKSHPDSFGGDDTAMKRVNNARDFLSDPKNRSA